MKQVFIALVLQIFLLLSPTPIFAHETQSDGPIGAILHVDPGDQPVAGKKSSLFFEFTDMEEKLNLDNCDCKVSITRGDQEILSQSFSRVDGTEGTSGLIDFTFPQSDIYKARVTGKPKEDGQFAPFDLSFIIRVENDGPKTISEAHSQPHNTFWDHVLHYMPTALLILILALMLAFALSKGKLTVLLLAALIVFHSLPVKAIHASHSDSFSVYEFECCLPVSATLPNQPVLKLNNIAFDVKQIFPQHLILKLVLETPNPRAPPY